MVWNAKLGTSRVLSVSVDLQHETNKGHARQRQEYALGDPSKWRMIRIARKKQMVGNEPRWKYTVNLIVDLPSWHPLDRYVNSPNNKVGIDLGVSSIASVGIDKVGVVSALLVKETSEERLERRKKAKEERTVSRKIDRSIRTNNPNAFQDGKSNKDGKRRKKRGRAKSGIKLHKSRTYIKYRALQADIRRKKSEERERRINLLATEIVIKQGKHVITENVKPNQWYGLWGGSVGRFAPTKLMKSVERETRKSGGTYTTINTHTTALSQSCLCGARKKKVLSNRVHECDCGLLGMPVQRDLWSAFLATCVNKTEVVSVEKDSEGNTSATAVTVVDTLDESLAKALWAGREGAGLCLQMASSNVNETRQNTAPVSIGDGRVAIMLKGTVDPLNDVTSGRATVLTGEGQGKTGKPRSKNRTNQQYLDVGKLTSHDCIRS